MITNELNDRRAAAAGLLIDRENLPVITGLGSPTYDVMAAGDDDNNFYLWAAMGSAATVGHGIQPDRSVLVVTGDGEMMMALGALATIAVAKPANLTIAVIDNGLFDETGLQVSHAGYGVEIAKVAESLGFAWTDTIRSLDGVNHLCKRLGQHDGPCLATIKVEGGNSPYTLPSRDGVHIKNRCRAALGYTTT